LILTFYHDILTVYISKILSVADLSTIYVTTTWCDWWRIATFTIWFIQTMSARL